MIKFEKAPLRSSERNTQVTWPRYTIFVVFGGWKEDVGVVEQFDTWSSPERPRWTLRLGVDNNQIRYFDTLYEAKEHISHVVAEFLHALGSGKKVVAQVERKGFDKQLVVREVA